MNRFLLIIIFFLVSSCELPSIIQADQYVEPSPVEKSKIIPQYENVWERIRASTPDQQGSLMRKR